MVSWPEKKHDYEKICNEFDLEYHPKLNTEELKPSSQLLKLRKILSCQPQGKNLSMPSRQSTSAIATDNVQRPRENHRLEIYLRRLSLAVQNRYSQVCVLLKKMLDSKHVTKDLRNRVSVFLIKF